MNRSDYDGRFPEPPYTDERIAELEDQLAAANEQIALLRVRLGKYMGAELLRVLRHVHKPENEWMKEALKPTIERLRKALNIVGN